MKQLEEEIIKYCVNCGCEIHFAEEPKINHFVIVDGETDKTYPSDFSQQRQSLEAEIEKLPTFEVIPEDLTLDRDSRLITGEYISKEQALNIIRKGE